jgi:hypothetical protein
MLGVWDFLRDIIPVNRIGSREQFDGHCRTDRASNDQRNVSFFS